VAIFPGGTLSRRTALAVLAGAVVSGCAPARTQAPVREDVQPASMLRAPGAEGGTGRYSHDSTPWAHLFVPDLDTGQRAPVTADYGRLAAFGSSTVALAGPRFSSEFRGMPFYNGGRGGEVAEQTLARLGSRPMRVDALTIPAHGPVVVRAENMAGVVRPIDPYGGTLAGVKGTVSASGRRHGAYTFTRTARGLPVEVEAGTAFLPVHGQRGCILILNVGKNNLGGAHGTSDVSTLLQWTRDAVAWNGGMSTLVMGHFVNTYTRRTGSALREGVNAYNAAASAEFGERFFDLGGFLTSPHVWKYAGIAPTADDRRQQAAGNKPPSLSRDNNHLNRDGEAAVARRVHEHLVWLRWPHAQPLG